MADTDFKLRHYPGLRSRDTQEAQLLLPPSDPESLMRCHIPRPPEAVWPVDGGAERERGDRTNAGNAHQPPADLLPANDVDNLLRQPGEFLRRACEVRKKRLKDRAQPRIIAGQFAHASGKGRARRRYPADRTTTGWRPFG